MATYTKRLLSGSTNGKPIAVAATATIGTTIHTAVTGTDALDEVWLWATNISNAAVNLTVEWGAAADASLAMKTVSIPAYTRIQIIDGQLLQNGLLVTAFAGTTNVINLSGFVHRIS